MCWFGNVIKIFEEMSYHKPNSSWFDYWFNSELFGYTQLSASIIVLKKAVMLKDI